MRGRAALPGHLLFQDPCHPPAQGPADATGLELLPALLPGPLGTLAGGQLTVDRHCPQALSLLSPSELHLRVAPCPLL